MINRIILVSYPFRWLKNTTSKFIVKLAMITNILPKAFDSRQDRTIYKAEFDKQVY